MLPALLRPLAGRPRAGARSSRRGPVIAAAWIVRRLQVRAPVRADRDPRARRLSGADRRADRRRHDRRLDPAGPCAGAGRAGDRRLEGLGRGARQPRPAAALLQRHPASRPAIRLPAPEGRISVDRWLQGAGRQPSDPQGRIVRAGGGRGAGGGRPLGVRQVDALPPARPACGRRTAGHVRLDGAEVHSWDRVDFGRHVGYLPQDVELFAGTVRDNIARMTDAPDDAVIEAARLAGVHEMILHLPRRLRDRDRAAGRVALGRPAAVHRARPGDVRRRRAWWCSTSRTRAWTRSARAALLDAIGRLKARGTTVILVVHRPSLLAHVDKVLVLSRRRRRAVRPARRDPAPDHGGRAAGARAVAAADRERSGSAGRSLPVRRCRPRSTRPSAARPAPRRDAARHAPDARAARLDPRRRPRDRSGSSAASACGRRPRRSPVRRSRRASISPDGSRRTVQHLEGGIIREILVEDGSVGAGRRSADRARGRPGARRASTSCRPRFYTSGRDAGAPARRAGRRADASAFPTG